MAVPKKNLFTILILLIIMAVLFVIAVTSTFVPLFRGLYSVFVPNILLAVLGIPVIILGTRTDVKKLTSIFILLAGASAVAIALGSVLHNLVSAAIMYFSGKDFEEPVLFIIATVIAPLGFLTGAIGTLTMYPKEK